MPQPLYDKYDHELNKKGKGQGTYDDPITYIQDLLTDDGIVMDYMTISLILKYFNDFKFNMLISGDGIKEPGLYTIRPLFRYRLCQVHHDPRDNGVRPCIRLGSYMEPEFRRALGSRFMSSQNVRDKITGGRELSDDDMDFIRRNYAEYGLSKDERSTK